ncbi:MAG: DmsE family decaheme c-type cytochrome [Chromatiales bacterium]|nr:DmsE family decaheme c-type cytochrome [Chromatiales bacterium]
MIDSGQLCMNCHNGSNPDAPRVPTAGPDSNEPAIWLSKHGVKADGRTPAANGGCQACHGDASEHLKNPKASHPKSLKHASADEKNEVCTGCHKGGKHMFWAGSAHESRGVACASCHTVHEAHDKARDKETQTEVCFTCHKDKRSELHRPSHHPVLEGEMGCSDCHNPHGSAGTKNLIKDSVNETCYQCHAEKRGPFVHNHQPVTEDCTICHNPHGTIVANMLKYRPPYLCQECHSHTSHPGQLPTLPGSRSTSSSLMGTVGRGCLNCHTNIHGGNSTQNSATAGRFRR